MSTLPLEVPRERLEGLMAFRVVLVTLFLGAALLVDIDALADLSSGRNTTILALIVGTYGLTIFYGLMLRAGANLRDLAVTQITLDLMIVIVLVDVSHGIDSPFLFLFLLTVVNAAIVLNRRAAVYTATAVTAGLLLLAADRIQLFAAVPAPGYVWKDSIFRVSLNAGASFVVAVLAGYLTERLGEVESRLELQTSNIRELKALNENILQSLSSGLLTVDPDGVVIFFNQAAEQITGRTSDDVLDSQLAEVMPEISMLLDSQAARDIRQDTTHTRDDGTSIYLGFSISALYTADRKAAGRIVIFQDLSEIREMESQVRRSERLAAVGRLSAAIAHEIRNPLASISGSVEMLSENNTTSPDDRALMGIIVREVRRLDELITEFLDYSRPRELTLVSQPPEDVLERVLDLFKNQDMQVEVRLTVDPGLAPLAIDGEAMQQVLWNLLNNALEAVADTKESLIAVGVTQTTDGVIYFVEDNGPGIPAKNADRIFQPFFTTKEGGTGLGLATIYRIVEDHGARCRLVQNGEMGGARFEIVFQEPQ